MLKFGGTETIPTLVLPVCTGWAVRLRKTSLPLNVTDVLLVVAVDGLLLFNCTWRGNPPAAAPKPEKKPVFGSRNMVATVSCEGPAATVVTSVGRKLGPLPITMAEDVSCMLPVKLV